MGDTNKKSKHQNYYLKAKDYAKIHKNVIWEENQKLKGEFENMKWEFDEIVALTLNETLKSFLIPSEGIEVIEKAFQTNYNNKLRSSNTFDFLSFDEVI